MIGMVEVTCCTAGSAEVVPTTMPHKVGGELAMALVVSFGKAPLDSEITSLDIAELLHALGKTSKCWRRPSSDNNSNAPQSASMLSPRSERPRRHPTTEKRYELAPSHCLPQS